MKPSFLARWFGKRQGTIRNKRKTRGVFGRPALELLEERLAPAQFALLNGALYNTSDSQWQQVNTEVLSYSVVNNQVFDLHVNGNLDSLQSDGSQLAVVDTNVRSFAFTSQGQLLVLDQTNNLSNWGTVPHSGSPAFQFLMDTGAASVGITPQGAVLELNQDGDLKEWLAAAQDWLVLRSYVQSFAVAGSGDAIILGTDGTLYDQYNPSVAGGAVELASAVRSFAIAGNGDVVWLDSAGNLYHQYDPGVPGAATQLAGAVQSFAIAGNGDVIWLNTAGNLFDQFKLQVVGDSIQIAGAVRSFAIAGSGDVIWLDRGGNLFDQANPQVVGDSSQIGSSIQSFAIAGDGDVIMLDASGNLTDQPASGGASVSIGSSIQSFVIAGNGDVITLGAGGAVDDLYIPSVAGDITAINPATITAIAVAGNGDLLMLDAQGNVYDQPNPRVSGDDMTIGTGMASIAIAANGDVTLVSAIGAATLYDVDSGIVAAPVFLPDGILVQDKASGAVSMIVGGQARSVSSQVYQYLGGPLATPIPDTQYTALPTGPAYYPNGIIVQDGDGGALGIIEGGLNCSLSSQVELYLGNPQATTLTTAEFQAIPTGAAYYPNGLIVQDGSSSGQISIIEGGTKQLLGDGSPDPSQNTVYQAMGAPAFSAISDTDYQAIPTGAAYYPNGMIVEDNSTGQISIIEGGLAELVGNGSSDPSQNTVYQSMGAPPVTPISHTAYQAIPTGPVYYPSGMIVQDDSTGLPDNGQISIIANDEKQLLGNGYSDPSKNPVYQSIGAPPFTSISDGQYQAIPTGSPYIPDGAIVQDASSSGQISIIEGGVAEPLGNGAPTNNPVYQYMGDPPTTIIAQDEYNAIPIGLPYYPSGAVVQDGPGGSYGIIQGNEVCPLPAEVYQYLGDPAVISLSEPDYAAIPVCSYYYGPGGLVANPSVEAVSILKGDENRGIGGSARMGNPQATLNSYAQEPALPAGLPYYPDGMIVQDGSSAGDISIIQGGLACPVGNGAPPAVMVNGEPVYNLVYQAMGDPPIVVIAQTDYQAIPAGLDYFPNGMIVEDTSGGQDNGQMSVIGGGVKQYLDPAVYLAMGNPPITDITSETEYEAIPTGLPYFPNGMVIEDTSGGQDNGQMSVIGGGVKQYLDPVVYLAMGDPPVTDITSETEYEAIPTGLPYFPNGMIVEDTSGGQDNGQMSVIGGGVKQYLDPVVYLAMGDPPVTDITSETEYEAIPTGLPYFPNGMIVEDTASDGQDNGQMSVIGGGVKQYLDPVVYLAMGDPPVTDITSEAEYEAIPTGLPYYPDGMIVQDGSSAGDISIIQGGLACPVGNGAPPAVMVNGEPVYNLVYQAMGDPPIVVIAQTDYQAIPAGLDYFPNAMIVEDTASDGQDNGQMSIIEGGVKQYLDPAVYLAMGDPPVTDITSEAEYEAIPTGLPYFPNGMVIEDTSGGQDNGQMSVFEGGVKQYLDPAVYLAMGDPPVTDITSETEYEAIPTGLPYFPNGMVIEDTSGGQDNGQMSILEGGVKQYLDPVVYLAMGDPPVTDITSESEYEAIPTGLPYYPEGMIVRDGSGGQISMIEYGVKELVGDGNLTNNPVYQYMGDPRFTIISDTEYEAIPTGLTYYPSGMIVQAGGRTSIIEGGVKCPVDAAVLDYLGAPPGSPLIIGITTTEYQDIPTGLAYFPDGMIVQDGSSSGDMSIIEGGVKQLVSAEVYLYLGDPQAMVIPDADYQAIPTGLQYFPDGMLVQNSSGTIDIIEGGEKHFVSYDVSAYLASIYGFTNDPPAVVIPDTQFNAIPTGLAYFPTGMIIMDAANTQAVSIIENGLKRPLPVESGFLAALGDPLEFEIPDAQYQAIPTGLMYFPNGMLVQDQSTLQISIIRDGLKCLVNQGTSGEVGDIYVIVGDVYAYLGNPAAVQISDAEYQAIPTGLPYFPDGMVVEDESGGADNGQMGIIEGGQTHPLSSEVQLYLFSTEYEQDVNVTSPSPALVYMSEAQFNAIPAGPAYFPDGMVVEDESGGADKGQMGIIEGGLLEPLASAVYGYLGDPTPTPIYSETEYEGIPVGLPYYPDGMVVQDTSGGADNGQMGIIEGGLLHSLSPAVYNYLGRPTPTPITSETQYESIPAGLPYFPDGMYITDGTNISIIEGGEKHSLSGAVEIYLGLSATSPEVLSDPSDYPSIPVGLPYYPDGMIVEDSSSGQISIIEDGQKEFLGNLNLPSNPIYQYLGSPPATPVSDQDYVGIPSGLPYVPEGMYVEDALSGAVDIIRNGEKHLVSPAVYTYLGLQSQQIVSLPASEFNAIPLGLQYYPEGMFVSAAGESICIIQNGQKCFVSSDVYQWLGGPVYTNLTDDQFNAIPTGPQYFPNGMVLASSAEGYDSDNLPVDLGIVEGGVKYLITDSAYDYLGAPPITTDNAEFNALRLGEGGATYYYPNGMIVEANVGLDLQDAIDDGDVSFMEGGMKHLLSSGVATYLSVTAVDVSGISASEYAAIPTGLPYYPDGMYVTYLLSLFTTPVTSIIEDGQRHFLSPELAADLSMDNPNYRPVDVTQDQYNAIPPSESTFYILNAGTLYCISGDSEFVKLDSNVLSFAVAGNGDVVYLTADGNLYDQWNPLVPADRTLLQSYITSFEIAGNGDVISFDANGGTVFDLWNIRVPGDATPLNTSVTSYAIAGDGNVVMLISNGSGGSELVEQWNARVYGDFSALAYDIASFAIAGNGDVIAFDAASQTLIDEWNPPAGTFIAEWNPAAGSTIETISNSTVLATDVLSFVIAGNGDVIMQNTLNEVLDQWNPHVAGDYLTVADGTSIAVAGNGDLIALWDFAPASDAVYDLSNPRDYASTTLIATGIKSIGIAGDGDLIMLTTGGALYDVYDPRNDGQTTLCNNSALAFAIAGNGDVIILANNLVYDDADRSGLTQIGPTDVDQMAVAGNGEVIILAGETIFNSLDGPLITVGGTVYAQENPRVASAYYELATGMSSILIAGNGDVIMYQQSPETNPFLYHFEPGNLLDLSPGAFSSLAGTAHPTLIATNVTQFEIGPNRDLFYLDSGNNLYDQLNPRVSGSTIHVDQNVLMFAQDNHGGLIVLWYNYDLYDEPEKSNPVLTENARIQIDYQVGEFAPDGQGGFYVASDDNLWDRTYNYGVPYNGQRETLNQPADGPTPNGYQTIIQGFVQGFYLTSSGTAQPFQQSGRETLGNYVFLGTIIAIEAIVDAVTYDAAEPAFAALDGTVLGAIEAGALAGAAGAAVGVTLSNVYYSQPFTTSSLLQIGEGAVAGGVGAGVGAEVGSALKGSLPIATANFLSGAAGAASSALAGSAYTALVNHSSFDLASVAGNAFEGIASAAGKALFSTLFSNSPSTPTAGNITGTAPLPPAVEREPLDISGAAPLPAPVEWEPIDISGTAALPAQVDESPIPGPVSATSAATPLAQGSAVAPASLEISIRGTSPSDLVPPSLRPPVTIYGGETPPAWPGEGYTITYNKGIYGFGASLFPNGEVEPTLTIGASYPPSPVISGTYYPSGPTYGLGVNLNLGFFSWGVYNANSGWNVFPSFGLSFSYTPQGFSAALLNAINAIPLPYLYPSPPDGSTPFPYSYLLLPPTPTAPIGSNPTTASPHNGVSGHARLMLGATPEGGPEPVNSSINLPGILYHGLDVSSLASLNRMPSHPTTIAPASGPTINIPPILPTPVAVITPADPVASPAPIPVHSFYEFSSIEQSLVSVWNNKSIVSQLAYAAAVAIGTAASGGLELSFNGGTVEFAPGQVTSIDLSLNGYSNTVAIQSLPSGVAINIKGLGSNTLSAPNAPANTWVISGNNSGTLDSVVSFSGVQFLQGGGNDDFQFQTGGSVTGNIEGGNSAVLDYSQDSAPVSVNTQTGQATDIGGSFNNVSTFIGNTNVNDRFTGTDDDGSWTLVDASEFQTSSQTFTFSGFQTIQGGSGNDTFNVEGTPTTGLNIYTGTGNDDINITPTSQNLANITGSLSITGQGGTDPLTVYDQADTAVGLTYNISAGSIEASTSASIVYGNMASFLLYAGGSSAGAVANIDSVSYYTPMTIDAGTSTPLTVNVSPTENWLGVVTGPLTLNDAAAINLDDQADNIPGTSTITATTVSVPGATTITYSGVPVLTLNADDSDNTYDLLSTAGPTIINTGSGNDSINVGSTANTLDPLAGPLTINGQGGADALTVNDQGTAARESYEMNSTSLTSRAGAVSVADAGIASLTLNGGQGANIYDVQGTPCPTTVNTGSGNDLINVGNILDALQGPLTVNGQGGTDLLDVNDQGTTTGQTYVLTSTTVTSRSGAVSITFSAMAQVTVNGGSGGNVFDVENTAAGTPVIVNTGNGGDTVNVSPTDQLLAVLGAALTVNGQANATLNLNDQMDQSDAIVYTVISTAVESSVSAPVYYNQVASINLHTSTAIYPLTYETLNIESTAAGTQLTVDASQGGAQGEFGNVIISPVANDLRNIAGSVFLNYYYLLNLTFDDQNDSAAGSYIITDTGPEVGNDPTWFASIMRVGDAAVSWNCAVETSFTTNGGSGANTYDIQAISGDNVPSLTLNTGPGNDTVNVGNTAHDFSSNPFLAPVIINGQGGTDQLNFNDQGDSTSGGASYDLASTADAVVPFQLITMPTVVVNEAYWFYYTGMAGVTINGATTPGVGFSEYGVDSTDSGTPVTLNVGSASDIVWVGSANHGLAAIAGNVTVNGQGGSDQLTVYDGAGTQDGTYTITNSTIQRAGSAVIAYSQVPTLGIEGGIGGTGAPTYNVESTAAGSTLNLYAEVAGETINFSPNAENLATIAGQVSLTYADPAGPVTVNIDDQNNGLNSTYTLNADGMSRPGAAAIDLNDAAGPIVLNGGSGSNTYDLPPTGVIQAMTVNTGSGNDTIDLSSAYAGYPGYPITINGQGGNDTLHFSGGLPGTITSTTLGPYVTYSGIARINIDGGAVGGANDIEVASTAPGTTVSITAADYYAYVNIGNSDPNLGVVRGTVIVNEQGNLIVSNLAATGNVQLSCMGTLDVDCTVTDSAGYTLSAANGIVVNADGVLTAVGTINGDLSNGGEIDLGQGGTSLSVNGDYSQTASGTLVVELLGATTYGQLSVSGAASLDGTLTAQTDNGYTVVAGVQFTVLTYGSLSGDFATDNLSPAGGQQLYTSFSANALTLTTAASPIISWNNPTAIMYGTALSSSQLDATANVPGTFTYMPAAGTVLDAGSNQPLDVTFTPSDSTDYQTVSYQVFLTVNVATLTITPTAGQSMAYGATLPTLAYVASGFVNGDSASLLTGLLGTTATSASPVGSYAFTLGSLDAGGNYTLVLAGNPPTIAVVPAALTIAPTPGQSMSYRSSVPTLSYVPSGFVNGDTASLLTGALGTMATPASSVGSYAFTLGSLSAGGNYTLDLAADSPTFAVSPRQLVVTGITGANKVYDGTTAATLNGLSTAQLTGILPGDNVTLNAASASGQFASKNVGTGITVTVSGLTLSGAQAANYTVTATTTANITPAPLTVTAVANTKIYDGTIDAAEMPTITAGSLKGTDTADFAEVYVSRNVGTGLMLTPEGVVNDGNGGDNYTVTFRGAAVGIISARPITVTAVANSKTYDGMTSAAVSPSITSGTLATGDTAEFIETYATKNVGSSLKLAPSGSVNDDNGGHNYAVTFQSVTTGQITPRTLTVSANNASKLYGHANPALKATFSGFAPGDSSSVLKGTASLSTTTKTSSGVGTYPITVASGTLRALNYSFVFVNGILTVTPAKLTVMAKSVNRAYGAANPLLTYTITGFVKGDTVSAVHGAAALSTTATPDSGVGTYPIIATPGTLSAANYTFSFVGGTVTVTKAKLTIAASNVTWVVGQPQPALMFTIVGLANGDAITPLLSTTASSTSPAGHYNISLKEVDGIVVKRLSPTGQADIFAVTLSSEDAVLENYSVLFVSATLTRRR